MKPKNHPYPRYKPSGIPWLAEIPQDWGTKRLKYTVKINAQTLNETTDPDYELKYIDISNVSGEGVLSDPQLMRFADAPSRARRIIRSRDVIISTVRTYLKAVARFHEAENNLIASTGFAVLRASKEIDPDFLYYSVLSDIFINTVAAYSVGVGYPAINPSELGCISLCLPKLEDQRAIVFFLDRETRRIDELVERKEWLIELLQEKRQAIISHAVTRGLNPAAPFKDSGILWLGKIPEHWEVYPVKRIATRIQTGCTPPTSEERYYEDGTVPWYGPGSFGVDLVLSDPVKLLNEEAICEGVARLFSADSVMVVCIGATIGKVGYLQNPASSNQQITAISTNQRKAYGKFLAYQLKRLEPVLQGIAPNTTLPILDQQDMGYLPCALPNLVEQKGIIEYLDSECLKLDAAISQIAESISKLREYRTALISAAVTGKIQVPSWRFEIQASYVNEDDIVKKDQPSRRPPKGFFQRNDIKNGITHFLDERHLMLKNIPRLQQELEHFQHHVKPLLDEQERMQKSMSPFLSSSGSIADMIAKASEQAAIFHKSFDPFLEEAKLMREAIKPHIEEREAFLRNIAPLMKQREEIAKAMTQFPALQDALKQIEQAHESWRSMGLEAGDLVSPVLENVQNVMAQVSGSLYITSKVLSGIDFTRLERQAFLSAKFASQVQTTFDEFSKSHTRLFGSMNTLGDVVSIPRIALPGANREILMTGYAISRVNPIDVDFEQGEPKRLIEEATEEVSECRAILERKFPQLLKPYQGAIDALRSKSEDRARHVLTSLRELVWHLLRLLAPNENVIPWIQSRPEKDLLDSNGKPTRRARLLYICRNINHGPFSNFINKDVGVMLELIDLFNQVHNIDPNFHDGQLKAVIFRTETGIMYIIRIHQEAN